MQEKIWALTDFVRNPEVVALVGAIFSEWQSVAKVLHLYTQIPHLRLVPLTLTLCLSVKISTRHSFSEWHPSIFNCHMQKSTRKWERQMRSFMTHGLRLGSTISGFHASCNKLGITSCLRLSCTSHSHSLSKCQDSTRHSFSEWHPSIFNCQLHTCTRKWTPDEIIYDAQTIRLYIRTGAHCILLFS